MKALKKYLKKRKSVINLLLQKPLQSYTPDTFHVLRVEIKKLHALFDLVDFCSKEFKQNKTFNPFKLIFRQAGKIRELQVETSLLEKHFFFNLPKDYCVDLKKELAKELKKFFSITNCKSGSTLKKNYRKIIPFLTKISKKKAQRYMDKKSAEIKKLLPQNTLKNKQMHMLRKRLKEYQYNQKSLNLSKQNKLISVMDVLPELLGEWHDYQVTINHLKKIIDSGQINPTENNQLESIKALFIFKREFLLNKINSALLNSLFRKG
ncbi:CHAD domain-containing protein [Flavobacterium sp. LT1R49]|uniref:CHAD domain-containing protein n=1 Tax=Flavobacterium arabinosi TaxID=3398737 RepID=UPI003A83E8C9